MRTNVDYIHVASECVLLDMDFKFSDFPFGHTGVRLSVRVCVFLVACACSCPLAVQQQATFTFVRCVGYLLLEWRFTFGLAKPLMRFVMQINSAAQPARTCATTHDIMKFTAAATDHEE